MEAKMSGKIMVLLKKLKSSNWIIDLRDIGLIFEIVDMHLLICNDHEIYNSYKTGEQLSLMVSDMIDSPSLLN